MRVFVSYSRAQYYFAEDLALALRGRGIDAWFDIQRLLPGEDWARGIADALRASQAFVLVASREALGSQHVRVELELARELGLPVVVALTERMSLPAPLAEAPAFDLRRGFERKLGALVGWLNGETVTCKSGGEAGVVRMLPFALLTGALLCGAMSSLILLGLTYPLSLIAWPYAIGALFCVWLVREVLAHKPKRILSLSFVLLIIALIGAALTVASTMNLVTNTSGPAVPVGMAILLLPGTAMIAPGVWVARSPAFYRWCPTGSAPQWMRNRMLARRGYGDRSPALAANTISYTIYSTEPDASVRHALEGALRARGHRPQEGGSADRQFCIVSDLTRLGWLHDTLTRLSGRIILVISGPIALDAMRDVERYQWVDHRRRRQQTLADVAATIGSEHGAVSIGLVPESLSTRVLPLPVFLCCTVYAGGTALMIAGSATVVLGIKISMPYGESQPMVSLSMLVVLGALWAYAGVMVARRRISKRTFLALFVGTALTATAFRCLVDPPLPSWAIAIFVVIPALYLAIIWRALSGWLPGDTVERGVRRLVPTPTNLWRRPGVRRTAVATMVLLALIIEGLTILSGLPTL